MILRIVATELPSSSTDLFREFDPRPIASASIGQVHRAVLKDGREVALKVQRPRAREQFLQDITLMKIAAVLLDASRLLPQLNARALVREFASWTAVELDYRREASNARRFLQNSLLDPIETHPSVFPSLTTGRVLTMSYVRGLPLVEIVRGLRTQHDETDRLLVSSGHQRKRIARHLDWIVLNQIYVDGLFHADLHPANIFILDRDVICFVDYGIVGRLSLTQRSSLVRYTSLLACGDVRASVREIMRWLRVSKGERRAIQSSLRRLHSAFLASAGSNARGTRTNFNLAAEVLQSLRGHRVTLHPSLLAYLKALAGLDSIRRILDPRCDVVRLLRAFFRGLSREAPATPVAQAEWRIGRRGA
jgi:ubiquinone biosynthesis protein